MNTQSNLYREISTEAIRAIFVSALQEEIIWATALMDGGLFNTTYLVEYGVSHKKAVLRLGPVNRHLVMGFEENLMEAEVYAYSLCHAAGIPCSHVLACDTSRQVIDRDFMIVEYPGDCGDHRQRQSHVRGHCVRICQSLAGDSRPERGA